MAQGRIRRLVTRRWMKWACVPIIAFVVVVAVAMGCAVWSPFHEKWVIFGTVSFSNAEVPRSLRKDGIECTFGVEVRGTGISTYYVLTEELDDLPFHHAKPSHNFIVGRAGLPFRCLRWKEDYRGDSSPLQLWVRGVRTQLVDDPFDTQRRIPLMPEPVGLVLNVLVFSAVIVLGQMAWRRAVVLRRKRRCLCVICAYPLGDFAVCPECGKPTGRDA